jgi:phospholipid/cholesterol/gamma-HCH transport system substrate-binding protein
MNARPALVGAFVLGGILLFAMGLFFIGDRRMLFAETFYVYAEFSEVAALDAGAKVRVAGMDAGEVETVQIPTGPRGRFRVRMRVREDLHPLIRVDSVATIQNDGLVGNKFVQIETGTEQTPQIADQGTIQSREPFEIADLLQKMSDTIDTVNTMLVDVKQEVDDALTSVSSVAAEAQELMNDLGTDLRVILASTKQVTGNLTAIVDGMRNGRGTIGKLLNDDSMYGDVKTMMSDAQATLANVRQASEQAKEAVADFRGEGGPARGLTTSLQQTLSAARDVMSDLADSTEALKRNFFFRGFFNRRGYFDLNDVSPSEYRRGALQTGDRRVLRIWLSADVLFAKDASGREFLTDGGRARLDSAMSEFVRYPPKSPLVVEGYADGATTDERYLGSKRRAELVRDYLFGKFSLDTNYLGIMPLGSDAKDSPSGATWNGIALAMFVPTSAFRSTDGS